MEAEDSVIPGFFITCFSLYLVLKNNSRSVRVLYNKPGETEVPSFKNQKPSAI
jgi:hypothetical protein